MIYMPFFLELTLTHLACMFISKNLYLHVSCVKLKYMHLHDPVSNFKVCKTHVNRLGLGV